MIYIAVSKKTDVDQHLLAYEMLYSVALEYFSLDVRDVPILKTEYGKPYFKSGELEFSISHTDGMTVIAVGDASMGIDVEPRSRTLSQRITERILNGNGDIVNWCRLEAFGKLTGEGFLCGYDKMQNTKHESHVIIKDGFVIALAYFGASSFELLEENY